MSEQQPTEGAGTKINDPKQDEKQKKREELQQQINLARALMEQQNRDTLKKLIYTSIAMFTIPLIVYFVAFNLMSGEYYDKSTYAGGAAVATVVLIMFGYTLMAWNETDNTTKQKTS